MRNKEVFSEYPRASMLYYVLGVLAFIIVSRLFYLQIIRHDYYNDQAISAHESKFEIPAQRGSIYALDGTSTTPLVLNEQLSTIYADPSGVKDVGETAKVLEEILGTSRSELEEKLGKKESRYEIIAKRVSTEKSKKIKEADLNGVGILEESYRVYPQGNLAAQTLGFVNNDSEGQYGIEEALNDQLKGENGRLKAVTDVYGIPLTTNAENTIKEPVDGKDLILTIDANVQKQVQAALAAGVKRSRGVSGSAIVIDPRTGAIKAMANYPSYNPAKYTTVDKYELFQNDVVSMPYETGSGVKVFTMSAGLNEGVITKDSTYFDAGYVKVGDREIENAGSPGGVTRTMTEVIQNSVNTGVVHVLGQLGGGQINQQARETLYRYFTEKYGFGVVTGVAQANEAAGSLIGPNEQEGNDIRYANMTFGQGMTVTMLQMVGALSAVLNGGNYYQPYLVHATRGANGEEVVSDPQVVRSNIIKPEVSSDIRYMMQQVIQKGGGLVAKRDGYEIGGKTGTSQVIDETTGEYSDSREVGSFMGYVGSSSPEYVIMTRVEEPQIPGYAGTVAAAPIFADISNYLIDYYQIPPS